MLAPTEAEETLLEHARLRVSSSRTSVAEACALLAEDPEGSVVFAGGTDILVDLKAGLRRPPPTGVAAAHRRARRHRARRRRRLDIGAMTTINRVARHERIRERFPGIIDAAMSLAAEQVRNQATVAGNLCMAVPSADMAPILLAHDASLRVVSPAGNGPFRLREFFVGPRKTVLDPADVVVAIEVPPPGAGHRRRQPAPGRPGVAVAADRLRRRGRGDGRKGLPRGDGGSGRGGADPDRGDRRRRGRGRQGADRRGLREAGELASRGGPPIDDLRATKEYRLELVKVLTRRVLAAADRAKDEL